MGWFGKAAAGTPRRLVAMATSGRGSSTPRSPAQQPHGMVQTPASDRDARPIAAVTSDEGGTTVEAVDSHGIDELQTNDDDDVRHQEEGLVQDQSAVTANKMSFDYDGEDTKTGYSKDYTADQPSTQMNMTHQTATTTKGGGAVSTIAGGGDTAAMGAGAHPQQNHLNSLFNGHLMKWKFEAEEGSSFIRVPAFFGSIALMTTAVIALVLYPEAWTTHSIVMSVCVITMSIFIAVLDGRFLATNPLSARAHLRNVLTRNFNIFRYVWGRSILYIVAGILNVAQLWLITICSGAFMIFIGSIGLIVGIHASRKFAALRSSLADESFLLLAFSNFDGDGDGYLAPHEFANLLADLGMELDDRYTLKAFNVIDTDTDRRISFDEFNHWWASGYIERGRKRQLSGGGRGDTPHHHYRRMD